MDYTQSPDAVTHAGTGHKMHSTAGAITTVVTDKDHNSVIWSLMEFVIAAGLPPQQFDPSVPSSYKVLKAAMDATYATLDAAQKPGEICLFLRTTAPNGFLKANGAAVSRTTYAALFAAIGTTSGAGDGLTTFNLPDARGEFFRGLDDGRGIDSGRGLGTAQAGQMPAHTHTYQAELEPTSMYISTEPGYKGRNTGNTGSTGGTENASENRPRNVAFLACIKY